jgi:hypothetical protein
LGIDADIVDNDRDLARVLADSMMIEREENREREEQKKREEEEKRRKEREELEKAQRAEEERKLAELAAGQGIKMIEKPKYLKMKVMVGAD